jgi:hypothetical protein
MDVVRFLLKEAPFTPIAHKEANKLWASFRVSQGASRTKPHILTHPDGNVKFAKTEALVYGLSLAQATLSGHNVCRYRTPECTAGCVGFAGMGVFNTVQAGRIRRTKFLLDNPEAFLGLLTYEIEQVYKNHGKDGRVRLNTFSDIPWEQIHPDLFADNKRLKFYDYTKWPLGERAVLPKNYRLTFSASERTTEQEIKDVLAAGRNVAVVFDVKRTKPLPKTYLGAKVIDGDKSDDRYVDPKGIVVGLRSKGLMRTQKGDMPRKVSV